MKLTSEIGFLCTVSAFISLAIYFWSWGPSSTLKLLGLGIPDVYYSLAVADGKCYVAKWCSREVKKKTFQFIFRCPNKSCPPHCYKNITIIKHLRQPKSIPKTFVPVGRPAANKALNLRETFPQLLIKYNTAKFHLQHIILIMGMEIIHSIAIQK